MQEGLFLTYGGVWSWQAIFNVIINNFTYSISYPYL
jgi:hypothetical protein